MKIFKISNILTPVVKKTSKVSTKKSLPIQTVLPLVSLPLVAYDSLKGIRDAGLTNYCNQAIAKLKNQLENGDIDQSKYNSHVRDIKNYYKEAKELPSDVSPSTIKQKEPSFKGDNSDYDVYSGNNDDDCCDCDSDDDCCDSDSDSDSDCDSGDVALSSFLS